MLLCPFKDISGNQICRHLFPYTHLYHPCGSPRGTLLKKKLNQPFSLHRTFYMYFVFSERRRKKKKTQQSHLLKHMHITTTTMFYMLLIMRNKSTEKNQSKISETQIWIFQPPRWPRRKRDPILRPHRSPGSLQSPSRSLQKSRSWKA